MSRSDPKTDTGSSIQLCGDAARHSSEIFSKIPQRELRAFLLSQRWFRSKGESIKAVSVFDAASASCGGEDCVLLFLAVDYAAKPRELYFAPFLLREGTGGAPLLSVKHEGTEYGFFDASAEGGFNSWLFERMRSGESVATCSGALRFLPEAGGIPAETEVRKMKGEQSNTSLVAGGRFMLKVLRMADSEINPEAEMLRFLTRRGYENVPRFRGDAVYDAPDGRRATFAILVDFVKSLSDGWEYALNRLENHYAGNGSGLDETLPDFAELGRVTARMHLALASDPADPAFRPEPVTDADLGLWLAGFDSLLAKTAAAAEEVRAKNPSEAVKGAFASFLDSVPSVRRKAEALCRSAAGQGMQKIRFHGDYHLGQVLKSGTGWYVTDFEGEPLRSIRERKDKSSPLKDAAGMLRSFSYAVYVSAYRNGGAGGAAGTGSLGASWHDAVRGAFLEAYRQTLSADGAKLFGKGGGGVDGLLSFFELEKAVYELHYEINNRPDWAYVPLAGIARLAA